MWYSRVGIMTLVILSQLVMPLSGQVEYIRVLQAHKRSMLLLLSPLPHSCVRLTNQIHHIPLNRKGLQNRENPASFGLMNIAGLVPDVDYLVKVVSCCTNQRHSCVQANKTAATKPDVPTGPPTNVRVISRGPTFVTIEWNDPLPEDINDRDGIVLYHIKLNGSKAGSTSERIFTLTDLQPGRTQHIQIIPVNDQGPCLPQHSAMLITSTTIYVHPPMGVSILEATPTSVRFQIIPSLTKGVSYKLLLEPHSEYANFSNITSDLIGEIVGLKSDFLYKLTVIAVVENGQSDSVSVTFKTRNSIYSFSTPVNTTPSVSFVYSTTYVTSDTSQSLIHPTTMPTSKNPPTSDPPPSTPPTSAPPTRGSPAFCQESYKIKILVKTKYSIVYSIFPSPKTQFTISFYPISNAKLNVKTIKVRSSLVVTSGLVPDVDYRMEVRWADECPPHVIMVTTVPNVPTGPPRQIRITLICSSKVTVEWSDPLPEDVNDRDGIVSYHLWLNGSDAGTTLERSFTFEYLQPGTTHQVKIIPINDQGEAADSFAGITTVTIPISNHSDCNLPASQSTPVSASPSLSTPVPASPSHSTPVTTSPSHSTPVSASPSHYTAVAASPSQSTPVTTSPSHSTPVAASPSHSTPVAASPSLSTPVATSPSNSTSVTSLSSHSTPVAASPSHSTPVAASPSLFTPVAASPSHSTPVSASHSTPVTASPSHSTPVAASPSHSTPVSASLSLSTPVAASPSLSTPVSASPSHSTPVAASPSHSIPVSASPSLSTPVSASPSHSTPVAASPSLFTAVTSLPSHSTPVTASPSYSIPVAASPSLSTPVSASPSLSTPVSASPSHSTPVSTSPSHSTPVAASPSLSTPVSASPSLFTAVTSLPSHSTPVTASPSHSIPVAASPSYSTPVAASLSLSTPVSASPSHSTPVAASPSHYTPVAASPSHSTPVAASPSHSTPVSASPSHSTPVSASPSHSTPVAASPSHSTPVAVPPSHYTPVAASPSLSTPVASLPSLSTPVSASPSHSTPVTSSPSLSTPVAVPPSHSTPVTAKYSSTTPSTQPSPILACNTEEKTPEKFHYGVRGMVYLCQTSHTVQVCSSLGKNNENCLPSDSYIISIPFQCSSLHGNGIGNIFTIALHFASHKECIQL